MTAYDVDLDELRATLADLAACQRDLVGIAVEIDQAQSRLQSGWSGRAADAEVLSYDSWRDGCADMVTALAGLRAIVTAADESYSRAASANVRLWEQVSA
ncbi:WXG100 family type VII secretion target [Nocardioides glacieisoli]|jgi:WXG100 family type VII secretion target|uniref:WXG100 family type VII secretion target n=1 Tax=Nocardioides glacieisoli TaxID=1168730 RepID=A0A4V1RKJ6_9ACTN|nr:WXG100 family type VII secretion target [Nocardioides glacieisoli]RYB92512.1 WXG100 family type VII secretion target [Nocardioides glacieisoli]